MADLVLYGCHFEPYVGQHYVIRQRGDDLQTDTARQAADASAAHSSPTGQNSTQTLSLDTRLYHIIDYIRVCCLLLVIYKSHTRDRAYRFLTPQSSKLQCHLCTTISGLGGKH